MIDLKTYYLQQLNNLNTDYTSYTSNYVTNFVNFKTEQITFNINVRNLNTKNFEIENPNKPYLVAKNNLQRLNNNYAALANEVKNVFTIKSNSIDSIQKKIDILTAENEVLLKESSNISDVNNASQPFFDNEREMYYRSIIYLITIVSGVIYILYLLQSTPFIEVAKNLAVNTKNAASNAIDKAKGANIDPSNPDASGNSSTKNMIILLLISIVIIAVFYFIIYLVRRANPKSKESNTEKEMKLIAESCTKDKSESWIMSEMDKVKSYLTTPDVPDNQ
jgi:TRAP-type C4-dicarboxylate transport system permease small subunit